MRSTHVDVAWWKALGPFILPGLFCLSLGIATAPWWGVAAAVAALTFMHEARGRLTVLLALGDAPGVRELLREVAAVVDSANLAEPPRVTLCADGSSPCYDPVTHYIAVPRDFAQVEPRLRRAVVLHEVAHSLQRREQMEVFRGATFVYGSFNLVLCLVSAGLVLLPEVTLGQWFVTALALMVPGIVWTAMRSGPTETALEAFEVEADLYAVQRAGLSWDEYDQLHHDMLERVLGVESRDERLSVLRGSEMRKRYSAVRDWLTSPKPAEASFAA